MPLDLSFPEDVQKRIRHYDFVTLPNVGPRDDIRALDQAFPDPKEAQMVKVPNSRQPGFSDVYRNAKYPDKLVSAGHPAFKTIYHTFEHNVQHWPDAKCLGMRRPNGDGTFGEYEWDSFATVAAKRDQLGSAIRHIVKTHASPALAADQFVTAIYAPNSRNWVVADYACVSQSLPSSVLYDTLGAGTSEYILNLVEAPIVFTTAALARNILAIKPHVPALKAIVLLDEPSHPAPANLEELRGWAAAAAVGLYTFAEALAVGAENPLAHRPPSPKDIYAIIFTSGTTGNPKGAMIDHMNITAGSAMVLIAVPSTTKYYRSDKDELVMIPSLPLAHIFERNNVNAAVTMRAAQGFMHGPILELMDDIKAALPSGMSSVPRLLNRIVDGLKAKTVYAPGLTGVISRRALSAKLAQLNATGNPHHPLWDRLWSSKLREAAGMKRLGFIASGSAPLSAENQNFLKAALSCDILQGYGLTESTAGVTVSLPGDSVCGSVGGITMQCEVRLRDLPSMGYTADDKEGPRGEILLRGPLIFKGYYKEPEKTRDAFDEDGWFYTGDVGAIDKRGRIFIVDRVKNFFKLAHGEYVGPEMIENTYIGFGSILNQIYVHGDSLQSFLVGVVGVNPDTFAPFVSKVLNKDIAPTDLAALREALKDKTVRAKALAWLNKAVAPAKLKSYEKIKNLVLHIEPMNDANDCLTPTMKIKRNVAAKVFKDEIDAMYAEGELAGSQAKL